MSSEGKFVALIPVEVFRVQEYPDIEMLISLVEYLAEKETTKFLPHSIITDVISENENLTKALPVVRKSKYGLLPVISDDGSLLGVVTTELIESKIADEVIAIQEPE